MADFDLNNSLLLKNLSFFHKSIPTPALLVDQERMLKNLRSMQQHAENFNVLLRPHCKTHKSIDFAKIQIGIGAKGITVAKTAEAEVMASAGINDIFIANQITQTLKISTLFNLNEKINLIVGIDHPEQVKLLKESFSKASKPLKVRIEIDCGFQRCGLLAEDNGLLVLAREIKKNKWLELDGLFTHAGHAYMASTKEKIKSIARQEAAEILKAGKKLKNIGIEIATISVGSTPTAMEVIKIPGVTEARPGNYIFFDGIQQSLGVCNFNQVSLFVLATVISQPSSKQIVCDAGSKALNLDKGAHSTETLNHFGTILNLNGKLSRLSEEHGIIELDHAQEIKIGSPLLIVPNHACVVANLYDKYYKITENKNVQTIPISARGMSQ